MKDYAKKSYKNSAGKTPKRTPRTRAQSKAKQDNNKQFWRYWAFGLVIVIAGLIAAQMFYNHHMKQEQQLASTTNKTPTLTAKNAKAILNGAPITSITQKDQPASKTKKAPPVAQKPQFDFYNVLPKSTPTTTASTTPTTDNSNKQFMLQVASYRKKSDAQSMQARLLLLGLQPIVKATSSGWYRVDIGPYPSKRAVDVVRHKVQKAGINGSMTRQI